MAALSRRSALRGAGVALALPLLDLMEPRGGRRRLGNRRAGLDAPVRLAVLYMPNGVAPDAWSPDGTGRDFRLSPILAPLAGLRSEVLVLGELANQATASGDGHYSKVAPFLTGTRITKTAGRDLRCGGVSLDQLVAQRLGHHTRLPSLELSIEPPRTGIDEGVGYTELYGGHISWSSPTTPVARELNPRVAFDRLFRASGETAPLPTGRDRSVLDLVAEDARRLERRVGRADREKLAEYLASVRSVEQRIAFDSARRSAAYRDDLEARHEIDRLGSRIREVYQDPGQLLERGIDHTEQVRLMLDLMVLAFWTDSTRVATFMFGNEVSGKNFSFLTGVAGGHHEISHHQGAPAKLAQLQAINTWHVAQYAYMLERMRSLPDGQGSLLDNSMVLFGSGMRDGNTHRPSNLPLVLGGRGGGALATGRHLVYPKRTPLCNLYVSLLARLGVSERRFGDSTGALPGLDDPSFSGVPQPA